jgi:hypothetical protein
MVAGSQDACLGRFKADAAFARSDELVLLLPHFEYLRLQARMFMHQREHGKRTLGASEGNGRKKASSERSRSDCIHASVSDLAYTGTAASREMHADLEYCTLLAKQKRERKK